MKNTSENIGNLFKSKLNDFSLEGNHDEWIELDIQLEKRFFLKFRPTHFNVYYSALAVICFLLSATVFIDHLFIEKEILNKRNNPQFINQKIFHTDTTEINSVVPKPIAKRKREINFQNQDSSLKKNSLPEKTEQATVEVKTELPVETSKPEPEELVSETKPKKKVVYITKQDTIVVIDTIKTNKRKKLK